MGDRHLYCNTVGYLETNRNLTISVFAPEVQALYGWRYLVAGEYRTWISYCKSSSIRTSSSVHGDSPVGWYYNVSIALGIIGKIGLPRGHAITTVDWLDIRTPCRLDNGIGSD